MHEHIYFRYPYYSPLYNLEIRRPEFGNSHKYNYQVQAPRHSRNGKLFSYSRDPNYQQVALSFNDIARCSFDEKWDIIEFFEYCAGDMFMYVDHEGHYWKAVLINNPFDFVHTARERFLSFKIELEIWDKAAYDLNHPENTVLDLVDYMLYRPNGDNILTRNNGYISTRP